MCSTGFGFMGTFLLVGCCLLCLQAINACVENVAGCVRCLPSGNCQLCAETYALDVTTFTCTLKQSNDCHPRCASGCANSGPGKCDGLCDPGFVLSSDNTCKLCDSNCDPTSGCTQSQAGRCDSGCVPGYVLTADKLCRACSPNCQSGCNEKGASRCDTTCDLGYALDPQEFRCFACDENCEPTVGCTKPFTCGGKCQSGYTLSNEVCFPCHIYCAGTCDVAGPFNCDEGQCKPGYTTCTVTKKCRACCSGCDATVGCSIAGPSRCDKCLPGYTLDTAVNACYPCDSHCDPSSGCDNAGMNMCDSLCLPGFVLQNGKCHVDDLIETLNEELDSENYHL